MKFDLDEDKINDIQRKSMLEVIKRARHAHYTNILMRINGQDELFQADWLKHLEPKP